MKITLAVLFLAGLTIYCKCTAVLSLPPSLIAHAASLEKRLKTQKPSTTMTTTDNGSDGGGGGGSVGVEQLQDEDEPANGGEAADLYKNLKNLWQKDLSLNLQKREHNIFEDDISDVATQQQQQQPIATIKNNNKIDLEHFIMQQHDNNGNNNNNNNILKTSPSATMNEATNLNIDTEHDQQQQQQQQKHQPLPHKLASEEYDSNEWLAPSTEMTDDIIVSPPFKPLLAIAHGQDLEPLEIATRQTKQVHDANFADPADESVVWNKYFRPLKYWNKQCPTEYGNNCPQEYYRALIADRNNALIKQLQYKQNMQPRESQNINPLTDPTSYAAAIADTNISPPLPIAVNNINNDDIILLLTAEQNLKQFLSWALAELYPFGKFSNITDTDAESFDPGMYMWKKLNLSGRVEPPLIVDEPHYMIVRREYDNDDGDDNFKRGLNYGGDPFIPPRGRKHNLPDLDSLLHRYETFVPNRGRRDKIKDIFKYEDLFYPNRGKRQMTAVPMSAAAIDIGDIDERNDNGIKEVENHYHQLNNKENVEQQFQQKQQLHPLSNEMSSKSSTAMEYIKNLMAKMKRKLHQNQLQQKIENSFDEMSRNKPTTTRMSTTFQQLPPSSTSSSSLLNKRFKSMFNILHKQRRQQQQQPNNYNARRQWLKRYTTASAANNDRPASVRSRSMATNRLQTLRSMSPLQQLTLLQQQQQQQNQQHHHLQPQQQQHQPDYLSPPLWQQATKFMWQQPAQLQQQPLQSLAQQFDPLSWHKLQMLQHQYHLPLLTMRHPRLTALQHLPTVKLQQQRQLQLATPQETQLTYSSDQIDNSITNDIENFFNKDLD